MLWVCSHCDREWDYAEGADVSCTCVWGHAETKANEEAKAKLAAMKPARPAGSPWGYGYSAMAANVLRERYLGEIQETLNSNSILLDYMRRQSR